jgi:hypothetical protein
VSESSKGSSSEDLSFDIFEPSGKGTADATSSESIHRVRDRDRERLEGCTLPCAILEVRFWDADDGALEVVLGSPCDITAANNRFEDDDVLGRRVALACKLSCTEMIESIIIEVSPAFC